MAELNAERRRRDVTQEISISSSRKWGNRTLEASAPPLVWRDVEGRGEEPLQPTGLVISPDAELEPLN